MPALSPDHVYALLRFRRRVAETPAARAALAGWSVAIDVRGPAGSRKMRIDGGALSAPSEHDGTPPSLVLIGDPLVLGAVFDGFLTTREAATRGQLQVLGAHADQQRLDALIALVGPPGTEAAEVIAIAS